MGHGRELWQNVITGEGNGKPLQHSCLENPMNSMKRQKDRTLENELPKLVGAQYATGDQWRNYPRKNEGMQPKQKQYPAVDVTGDRSKIWCCEEQYCIGTWNVRYMNQGKLEVVKQEMARVNVNIIGIRELKWIGMKTDLFQSCGHCWVFQICWHTESSTFTASSFRIWNSSTGIPSPSLALFVVML